MTAADAIVVVIIIVGCQWSTVHVVCTLKVMLLRVVLKVRLKVVGMVHQQLI